MSAPLRSRLDDDRRAQTGDDPVAGRKRHGALDAGRVLRDDEASGLDDSACELGVGGRVVAIHPAPSTATVGPPASSAPRCASPSPTRHPADDDESRCGELAPGRRATWRPYGEQARTDDRGGRPGEQLRLRAAAQVEPGRRVVNRGEQGREALLEREEAQAGRAGAPAGPLVEAVAKAAYLALRGSRRGASRSRRRTLQAPGRSRRRQLQRRAVGERLGDVLGRHLVGTGERGDGARDSRRPGRARGRGSRSTARSSSSEAAGVRLGACARPLRAATTRSRTGPEASSGLRPARGQSGARRRRGRSGRAARASLSRNAASRCCGTSTAPPGRRGRRRDREFIVPTSWKRAGKIACPPARATATTPSSSGWRRASSTGRWNSASSSSRSTPRWASDASPGRGPGPPPTIAAAEVWGRAEARGQSLRARIRRPSGCASPDASSRRRRFPAGAGDIVLPVPGGPASRRLWPPAAIRARGGPLLTAHVAGQAAATPARGHGEGRTAAPPPRVATASAMTDRHSSVRRAPPRPPTRPRNSRSSRPGASLGCGDRAADQPGAAVERARRRRRAARAPGGDWREAAKTRAIESKPGPSLRAAGAG